MAELLTVGQAATLAGVSVRTMRRRVAAPSSVMTAGHGQARRIVAASVAVAPPPGDSATDGRADVTPASDRLATPAASAAMTEAMTEDGAAVTADSPAVTPATSMAMAGLVALADRLTSENRELSRQLVDVAAAAAVWQERAGTLADRLAVAESRLLALGAPESPLTAPTSPEPPDLTPEPLLSFPWPVPPSPDVRALAPWLLSVLAIVVAVVVLLAVSAVYG
jgi:hypothetical protein